MSGDRAAKCAALVCESVWLCVLKRVMERDIAFLMTPVAASGRRSKKAATPTNAPSG
jgi:hypothetical protein